MINFPNAPAQGQTFNPPGGYQYIYLDGVWRVVEASQNVTAETRNRFINGGHQISQEYGDTAVTAADGYPADQWYQYSLPTGFTLRGSGGVLPSGNRFYLASACSTGQTLSNNYFFVGQKIEGFRAQDFRYGFADAKRGVLRFAINAMVAGTYCISVRNSAVDRSYVAEYTISAGEINQWVIKTLVIPGDTTGTWLRDNGSGMNICWCYANGVASLQQAVGWGAGNKIATVNQVNAMAVAANYVNIGDIGFYLDPRQTGVPPSWEMPEYTAELTACLRYWEKVQVVFNANLYSMGTWRAIKRINPAMSINVDAGSGAAPNPFNVAGSAFGGFYTTPHGQVGQGNIVGNARM